MANPVEELAALYTPEERVLLEQLTAQLTTLADREPWQLCYELGMLLRGVDRNHPDDADFRGRILWLAIGFAAAAHQLKP